MSDGAADTDRATDGAPSPLAVGAGAVRSTWSTLRTVYYANSLSWRFLKSGALVFLGFFLWAASNLLYAYNPALTPLRYSMAYGFVLIGYGPLHHVVVLPLALRWRRGAAPRQRVGRHLPNAMLVCFLAVVVVAGTVPPGPMVVDFRSSLGASGPDISPDLLCVKSDGAEGTEIHCHLTESRGVDRVVVETGGTRLVTDDDPPYEFTVREADLATVTGEKQFTVRLLDADGSLVRRYTRRVALIETG